MPKHTGIQNREVRGRIMRLLRYNHPHPIGDQLFEELLVKARYPVSLQDVQSHFAYLEDKGYVKVESVSVGVISRQLACLTSKGIDFIEGNLEPDPGIRWLVE